MGAVLGLLVVVVEVAVGAGTVGGDVGEQGIPDEAEMDVVARRGLPGREPHGALEAALTDRRLEVVAHVLDEEAGLVDGLDQVGGQLLVGREGGPLLAGVLHRLRCGRLSQPTPLGGPGWEVCPRRQSRRFVGGPPPGRPGAPPELRRNSAAHRARGCYYTADLRFSVRPCGTFIPTRRRACADSGHAAGIEPGIPAPDHADRACDRCPRPGEPERHRLVVLPFRPSLPCGRSDRAGRGRRPPGPELARRQLPLRPPGQAAARGDDQVVAVGVDRRGRAAGSVGAGRLGRDPRLRRVAGLPGCRLLGSGRRRVRRPRVDTPRAGGGGNRLPSGRGIFPLGPSHPRAHHLGARLRGSRAVRTVGAAAGTHPGGLPSGAGGAGSTPVPTGTLLPGRSGPSAGACPHPGPGSGPRSGACAGARRCACCRTRSDSRPGSRAGPRCGG